MMDAIKALLTVGLLIVQLVLSGALVEPPDDV